CVRDRLVGSTQPAVPVEEPAYAVLVCRRERTTTGHGDAAGCPRTDEELSTRDHVRTSNVTQPVNGISRPTIQMSSRGDTSRSRQPERGIHALAARAAPQPVTVTRSPAPSRVVRTRSPRSATDARRARPAVAYRETSPITARPLGPIGARTARCQSRK